MWSPDVDNSLGIPIDTAWSHPRRCAQHSAISLSQPSSPPLCSLTDQNVPDTRSVRIEEQTCALYQDEV